MNILLAKRPDLVKKLERYGFLPAIKTGGPYYGCAKLWAKEKVAPYDTPETQALAERLPAGWEEVTEEELSALVQRVKVKEAEKRKEKLNDRRGKAMLKNLSKIAFLGIATTASVIVGEEEKSKERTSAFSLELILNLINEAKVLDTLFSEISRMTVSAEQNQKQIAEVLKFASLVIALLSAAKGRRDVLFNFITAFKEPLLKGASQAESLAATHEQGKEASLFLGQIKLSLEKEDVEGFYEIIIDGLGLAGVKEEDLMDDFKKIHELAQKLKIVFTTGLTAETTKLTTLSQAM